MKTILLIEDNEMMRMFLTHYLGKDYDVNSVKNSQEASDWLKFNSADLIVSDFPTNPILASQIRNLGNFSDSKQIPIVMITDQDKSEQRIQAFHWGVKDCISKPFNPIELKLRVQTHLPSLTISRQFRPVA